VDGGISPGIVEGYRVLLLLAMVLAHSFTILSARHM